MSRLLIAVTLVVTALLGCGGGGGGGSPTSSGVKITGVIGGNGYAKLNLLDRLIGFLIPSAVATVNNTPDAILVIYDGGDQYKIFPVSAAGSFSIDTSTLNKPDLVAFLINQNTKQFFCNINLPTGGGESLDVLLSNYMKKDVELGRVDSTNGCLSNSSTSSTGGFSSSDLQELQNIARSDDPSILYINKLLNDGIQGRVAVRFKMGAVSTVLSQYNQLSNNFKADYYDGSYPLFYIDSSLGTNITSVDLYPPSAINYGNNQFGAGSGYPNVANTSTPMTRSGLSYNPSAGVTTVETFVVDSYPQGKWMLKNHSSQAQLGEFYFAGANPFDSNNYFKGVIPKLNVDSNGIVNVKYYRQNSSGSYEQVDRAFFEKIARNIVFSYVLGGSNTATNFSEGYYVTSDTVIRYTPPSSINVNNIARLIYSYEVGGSKYQFFFE